MCRPKSLFSLPSFFSCVIVLDFRVCVCVCVCVCVTQLCPTLCDPMVLLTKKFSVVSLKPLMNALASKLREYPKGEVNSNANRSSSCHRSKGRSVQRHGK